MKTHYYQRLLFVLLVCGSQASFECPEKCTCYLDKKGRRAVSCTAGGKVGPLTLSDLQTDTEVLRITAPEDNMNELTMSPAFRKFKKLEEIHITRSNIPQLGDYFFYGLQKLDVLDLSQNNITQPLENNFRGLTTLKELYLDDNRISSLPSGTFRHLHELQLLSLQRNRMTELMPRLFLEIRKLKVLKLSGNSLVVLNPVVFEDIKELHTLECRSCGLKKIDSQVYELLPHLTHLDLGDNELTHLTSEEFKALTGLAHLRLDFNRLTAIRGSVFGGQHELKRINLAHNAIAKISPSAFDHLHNLTDIDLSHNKLQRLDAAVFEPVASNLEILALGGNHFTPALLRESLTTLESLRVLKLPDSGLTTILDGTFPESLAILELPGNHLTDIQPEIIPKNLVELDLSRNRFRGLAENTMERLESLRVLKLDDNPLTCDLCHILPLLDRTNRSLGLRDLKCVHPYAVKGKRLGDITRSDLTWCTVPYSSSDANYFLLGDDNKIGIIAAGTSVCLLFLTIIAILAALIYSRRHAAKYYTHEDKLAMDGDSIFETHSPLFCEERELSFKFPLESAGGEKKLSVSTIDGEIKKEHAITNGT